MAEIFPFRAVRYNSQSVALADVLTQPYDKITAEMQQRYSAASPYNLIGIERGMPEPGDSAQENVYTRAEKQFGEWLAQGILVQDAQPAIYAYFQNYDLPGTTRRLERRGFIALGRLTDYREGIIFRHEQTLAAPKADRLELLRHTRCQTGQLFLLYEDSARRVDAILEAAAQAPPIADLRDEYGVQHRLWAISDAQNTHAITEAMAAQKLVIADGHHRYETALAYRDECRAKAGRVDSEAPWERAMWTCFNICQSGYSGGHHESLTILPTHRLVHGIAGFSFQNFLKSASQFFNWYAYPFAKDKDRQQSFAEFRRDLERRGRAGHTIGVYAANRAFYLLVLRDAAEIDRLLPDVSAVQRQLGVVLLHRLLLHKCLGITADKVFAETNLRYEREMESAIAAVERAQAQIAFLLNPVPVKTVMQIALGGDVMPQKSTDFYPKLLSGICIYKME